MHIAIDVRPLQTAESGDRGIGSYARNWLKGFFKLPYQHRVSLLVDPRLPAPDLPLSGEYWQPLPFESHARADRVPDLEAETLATWKTSVFLAQQQVDLFHMISPFEIDKVVGQPPKTIRTIVTFHDAIPIRYRDIYLVGVQQTYKEVYRVKLQSLAACSRIIVNSQATARDLTSLTNISQENVDVVYGSVSPELFVAPSFTAMQHNPLLRKIGQPYLLSVLGEGPHKNTEGLIAAFCQLPSELRSRYKLVITYRITERHRQTIADWLRKYPVENQVIFTDWISREDLQILYANTALYVHPALYEGFGLPIVEAMAMGAPVVTSNTASMKEIVGDNSQTFDPWDTGAIAVTMAKVLLDSQLRASLRALSRQQAQHYTAERAALAVRQSYEKALSSSAGSIALPAKAMLNRLQMTVDPPAAYIADNLREAALVAAGPFTVQSHVPVLGGLIARMRRNLTSHVTRTVLDPLVQQQMRFNQLLSEAMAARLCDLQRIWDIENASRSGSHQGLAEHANDLLDKGFYAGLDQIDEACRKPSEADHRCTSVGSPSALVDAIRDLAARSEDYYQSCRPTPQGNHESRTILGVSEEVSRQLLQTAVIKVVQPAGHALGSPVSGRLGTWGSSLTRELMDAFIRPALENQTAFNRLAAQYQVDLNPGTIERLQERWEMRPGISSNRQLTSRFRAYLTAHVRAYFDILFERQARFNRLVTQCLNDIAQQPACLLLRQLRCEARALDEGFSQTSPETSEVRGPLAHWIGYLRKRLDDFVW